jgi:hypothetical protein
MGAMPDGLARCPPSGGERKGIMSRKEEDFERLEAINADLVEALNVVRGILPASGSLVDDYLHLVGEMGHSVIDEALARAKS